MLSSRGNTTNNYLPNKAGDLIDEEDVPDVDESEPLPVAPGSNSTLLFEETLLKSDEGDLASTLQKKAQELQEMNDAKHEA